MLLFPVAAHNTKPDTVRRSTELPQTLSEFQASAFRRKSSMVRGQPKLRANIIIYLVIYYLVIYKYVCSIYDNQ